MPDAMCILRYSRESRSRDAFAGKLRKRLMKAKQIRPRRPARDESAAMERLPGTGTMDAPLACAA
jgi:hypothetical protein